MRKNTKRRKTKATRKVDDPWPLLRVQALEKANYECEGCGVKQYATVLEKSRVQLCDPPSSIDSDSKPCREARNNASFYHEPEERAIVAVLSVIRLNGLEFDTRPENLRCLCQRCHNQHTAERRSRLLIQKSKKFKKACEMNHQKIFGFAL